MMAGGSPLRVTVTAEFERSPDVSSARDAVMVMPVAEILAAEKL